MALTSWCWSSVACKVGRRIRQRGFLVGWYDLTLDPADLRRLRSDARSGRVLGAVLSPSCASWTSCRLPDLSNVLKCFSTTASLAKHPNGKPSRLRRVIALVRDLQKIGHSMDLSPSSFVSYLAHSTTLLEQHHRTHSIIIDQCAFGTPWKLRTRLIVGHCDYHDILALAENTCEDHHVRAFSRRPHIQLRGSDLSGRKVTARTKLLPPRLCPKLCNIYHLQRNWTQMTPAPSSTRKHPTSSALWDDLGLLWPHFEFQQCLSWLALYPRPSRPCRHDGFL